MADGEDGAPSGQLREPQVEDMPANINFAAEEEKVLAFWDEIDAFQTSFKLSEGRPEFTFYDGPPFATGLPHYGHLLAGTIKDTVTRYAHQTGHHVRRRFGWDCHGLPVEYEIDQTLGIKSRDDVLAMGIATYNSHCRGIVSRYTKEWEGTVKRLGRWIDFANDYKTMDPAFMESVWWVFRTLHEKGLVYRGYKVMPFSTACATPLSNFEAGLNYKDVKDPSIVVAFQMRDDPDASLLAWTSTPWTLPSNLALCVNPEFEYIKIRDKKSGKAWILSKDRLVQVYPVMGTKKWKPEMAAETYEVLETIKGSALVGIVYEPLFPYFKDRPGSFTVLSDSYVTADDGTGIVHQAPAFGEDDYRVCLAHEVVAKGEEVPCPVDANGRFTDEVPDFKGRHVKEADNDICAALKAKGRLIIKDQYTHSYPYCWRSDTPLIYKAVPSWFVAVEAIKDRLLVNNEGTYWVPANVKEKRFHNWLSDAKDWAISRNRFWGTPIPLWTSEDGEERIAIGSVEQLHELSGVKITDLHRESIDHITIPSQQGKGVLRRVDEVFDCWFESGSMPYAQLHYPFENKERFEAGFPADFIAEGLDQTRGWFYTLSVLSTALFDKPPFKNLVCNGLVLAEDGKKMSKRLKNYPDPNNVITAYGADALRLYLIDSPVVRAEPLRFREPGVQAVVKDVLLPWFNTLRFFVQQARRWEALDAGGAAFKPSPEAAAASTNVMDIWVMASLQGLVQFVHQEMAAYRLYTVVPRLVAFIKDLTNWYVRLNRSRLKGSDGHEEALVGLACLYEVLLCMSQVMAPFMPFFSEYVYQRLRKLHPNYTPGDGANGSSEVGAAQSVHYLMLPQHNAKLLNRQAEADMAAMQTVIELARTARDKRNISLKMPVKEMIVVTKDQAVLSAVEKLAGYVRGEMNVWQVTTSSDEGAWCTLSADPNNKLLGRRFGKGAAAIKEGIAQLTDAQLSTFMATGAIDVAGAALSAEELLVRRAFRGDAAVYEACVSDDGGVVVVLDTRRDERVLQQRTAREALNRVQKLRKKAGLNMGDKVEVFFSESAGSTTLSAAIAAHVAMIRDATGSVPLPAAAFQPPHAPVIASDTFALDADDGASSGAQAVTATITLTRPALSIARAFAARAAAAGLDGGVAAALLASVDALGGGSGGGAELPPQLELTLDGKTVVARCGEDYFGSALALLRGGGGDGAGLEWAL